LGSNLLVADEGFDGIVIRCGKGLDGVEIGGDEREVWSVGAGLPTPTLARKSAAAGRGGLHRLIGVPGTVGGGVFMNASAHGQEFSRVVRSLRVVNGRGVRSEVRGGDVAWRYRGSGLDGHIVLGATLAFEPTDPTALAKEVEEYLARRRAGTPFNEPCCGSVFRNPARGTVDAEYRTAGQLVEAAGLKGESIGGAQVSPKHANYIVNTGGATAADVLGLIERVRSRVLAEFGVELELEVKVVGQGT
jgi:UDP-N-acetylmuramate dehydrogenase